MFKFGQMERDMKESGVIIKQTVKENFGMLMEIFTKENGRMIKQMDLVFTLTKMEQDMKVIGLTIYNMVLELKLGEMEVNIRVNIMKV